MNHRFNRIGRLGLALATFALAPCTVWAQEEPIAVAAPVKETSSAKPVDKTLDSAADKRVRPLTVSAQLLRSDLVITGALMESTQLNLKTAFGDASIPLSEVAGVRFPSGQDTSTTLVMLNGDSITGASDVKSITIETEWGTAKVNGENISSMMFVPGLEWQSINGLNGTRWTLTEAKAKPTTGGNGPGGLMPANSAAVNSSQGALNAPNNNAPRVVFPR